LAHLLVDEIRHLWVLVHHAADAVAYVLCDDAESVAADVLFHGRRHFAPPAPATQFNAGDLQHLFAYLEKPLPFRPKLAHGYCHRGIRAPTIKLAGRVDLEQIAFLYGALAGNAVDDLFIDGDARGSWERHFVVLAGVALEERDRAIPGVQSIDLLIDIKR